MDNVKKRKSGIYYTNFSVNGFRVRKSTGTKDKALAREFAHKLYEDTYAIQKLGHAERRTWRNAATRYALEKQDKSSWEDIKRHLVFLEAHLGELYLDQIDSEIAEQIIEVKLSEGVKGATVNRLTGTLKAVLTRAHKYYKWIDSIPPIRKLQESKGRLRWLTKDEFNKLVFALPPHARTVVKFAVLTGKRKSNVMNLKWDHVDLDRGLVIIPASEHKNGKEHIYPINRETQELLKGLKGQSPSPYVFTYKGNHLRSIRKTYERACKVLGFDDVSFHTLRHTWASWMVQSGVSMRELQELGGWSDLSMVMRYSHLSAENLADAQEKISLSG